MHNDWLVNVVAAAGKPYSEPTDIGFSLNPVKAVKGTVRSIARVGRKVQKTTSKALKKIPVMGPTLDAAWSMGPIGGALTIASMAGRVANGDRIDRVAYDALKKRVKDVKTVLPLATMIIGAGGGPPIAPGAEGVVAAGNAISKAMPIAKPALDAVRAELGKKSPDALKAFDLTLTVLNGSATTATIPAPIKEAGKILSATLAGKPAGNLDAAIAGLPTVQKNGVKTALTFYTAQKVQGSTRDNTVTTLPTFVKIGNIQIGKDAVLKLAEQELRHKPEVQKGFSAAVGVLAHKANPTAVIAARDAMTPEQRKGFDIGASVRVGQLAAPLKPEIKPREKLGFYLAKGSEGLKPEARKQILQSVQDPTMVKGVRMALTEEHKGIFERIVEFFLGAKTV